jgi:hypothetical protein
MLVGLLCLPMAGCGMGGATAPVSSGPSPAAGMTVKQRFAAAKPAVETYLRAAAMHRIGDAQGVVQLGGSYADQRTLSDLQTWFGRLPIGAVQMTAHPLRVKQDDAIGVRVTMRARFGPAPLSTWIPLGDRVLLARYADSGWRVTSDITGRRGAHVKNAGLRLFHVPTVLTGKRATVIYEAVEASNAASQILADADDVVPELTDLYAHDRASRHPVVFVVDSRSQGERLSGVKIFRKEVPQGFVINGVAYIEWRSWEGGDVLDQDGTIAHELTHVASEGFLGRAPHSLLEGLAMYEEDRFLRRLGFGVYLPLTGIAHAYRDGSFPSISVWRTRVTDWGLRNPAAVNLCYEDGQAMSAVIYERHGGAAGIGRLARAFTALHASHHGALYSETQVREAFQRGLGVSFDQVVAEAHAYAAAHAG